MKRMKGIKQGRREERRLVNAGMKGVRGHSLKEKGSKRKRLNERKEGGSKTR